MITIINYDINPHKSSYLRSMIRIVILGAGNVSTHLCKAFNASEEILLIQLYSRNKSSLKSFSETIETTSSISELKAADVYIIAIADDSIKSFSETLPFKDKLVVHTSGSMSISELSENNRKGVFYPLQTFTKESEVDFINIPICIEASTIPDLKLLKKLGRSISEKVVKINSDERAKLHLAAVFVNNFVNHLYQKGSEILEENSLPFDLLKPLIIETVNKIESLSPKEAQTGPAKRNDIKTIEKHLHLLKNSTHKELYLQLTKAIQKKYNP